MQNGTRSVSHRKVSNRADVIERDLAPGSSRAAFPWRRGRATPVRTRSSIGARSDSQNAARNMHLKSTPGAVEPDPVNRPETADANLSRRVR